MKLSLKKLLVKVLQRVVVPNVSWTSILGNQTATTEKTVATGTHTSRTGRVLVIGMCPLYTSRYTSAVAVKLNGVQVASGGTNVQPVPNVNVSDMVPLIGWGNVPVGTPTTVTVTLRGQDSGTTATIPAYHSAALMIVDIVGGVARNILKALQSLAYRKAVVV